MLRRKPTKVQVKVEDKEELEESRRRFTSTSASTSNSTYANTSITTTLLQQLDHSKDNLNKAHRIGLNKGLLIQMEVEVKLRIPDAAVHEKLSDLLKPFHVKTHHQENVFFDGSASELSSKRAVLRLRFYDGDSRCIVCLKAKAVIVDGVSRVEEDEEEIDPSIARACVSEPSRLGLIETSRILKRVKDEFGCQDFFCLGGFHNVRAVHDWEQHKLELDETQYAFGTSYELECESTDPDSIKKLLEEFLQQNGIPYNYSEFSKFAVFRSGKLPE